MFSPLIAFLKFSGRVCDLSTIGKLFSQRHYLRAHFKFISFLLWLPYDPSRVGPDCNWNNFDFWLVLVCYIPPSFTGGNVAFLRLLRLMRLLKLVGKVKQLQVIVMGLLQGLSSVTYILILLGLVFYLFAVLGVGTFRKNDPFHFGSLGVAMLTLFLCGTLEAWSNCLYINSFGCNSQNIGVNSVKLFSLMLSKQRNSRQRKIN